jgi:hypothetical protein
MTIKLLAYKPLELDADVTVYHRASYYLEIHEKFQKQLPPQPTQPGGII